MPKVKDIRAAVAGAAGTPPETAPPDIAETAPASAEPVSEPASAPRKFHVKLKDNPAKVVEALDRLDATRAYNEACGILSTPHPHDVHEIED